MFSNPGDVPPAGTPARRVATLADQRVDFGVAETCSASTPLVCSPSSATLGSLCSGEPEKRKGGAGDLGAGAVLDGAELAAMLDLRVLQRLGDGEIGRAWHAVRLQRRDALLDRELSGPLLELVDELGPVHAPVGVFLEARVGQPVASSGGR